MDFLAFDLGASSGRITRGSFDGERLRLSPVHSFENRMVRLGGGLYWDFTGIFERMCEGLRKAAAETPFHSFGIDSFNNDYSLISPQGDLLAPVRAYRDPRTQRHAGAIYEMVPKEELYAYTGNQLAPFNTFMQLAAMRREGQGWLLDNAHRLLFLPDLLGYYISGQEYTEYTIASETQMLDWETRDWIPPLLEKLGISKRLFAPIVMPGTVISKAGEGFLREQALPEFDLAAVCEHDTASAFLAAPAGPDSAILSCGTWTILGAENDRPVISEYGFAHNFANEGSLPRHHRICYNVMGLWLIQQLRGDFARLGKSLGYGDIQALAMGAPAFQGFINPDGEAFYAPGSMAGRIIRHRAGVPAGAAQSGEPGPLLRMVYESLAMKYRWALEKLEALLGRRFNEIRLVGGGSRDAVLCQFTANATGRPVIAGPAEASSVGNILVQMLARKQIGSIAQGREIIKKSFPHVCYLPDDTARWEEQYARFLALALPGEQD